ncbi:hypothetical protein BGZ80_011379 [Entomortierella chlamydospora]|uniref:Uncharacterized protein n=1 Tax=Entomortierella chlamydospora TaxID=101097 RepID=A0A9P6SZ26_9FUNG|nr:hypothetical protein BGZ79_007189 [Entomortierella chlamydospora]KAG0012982.1 hypothetical protein BGZ80_011379 [Entomortierella chlamydospora]
MPSTRFEARNQARAIPLVTVSLASGHLRQTRLANDIDGSATRSRTQDHSHGDQDDNRQDHPPPYDSVNQSTVNGNAEVATQSPSNKDLTEAVLHLSRTLVSTSSSIPKHPSHSWLFMMIYSWTRTQQTTAHLYHFFSKPVAVLKGIKGQNDQTQLQQYKRQRKSIQQMTEEQDMMEDDPDMLNATEMIPVNMMNTRSVASMEESLPDDPQEQDVYGYSSDDDPTIPRKPKRRIYTNPFGSGVTSEDELEDDEGWYGHTKSNSVLLTSTKLSHSLSKSSSEPPTSSLGPAMDPRQFESEGARTDTLQTSFPTPSLFNTPRSVTKASRTMYSADPGTSSSLTTSAASETSRDAIEQQQQQPLGLHTDPNVAREELWSESSNNLTPQPQSILIIPDNALSTSTTTLNLSSTAISTANSVYVTPSSSPAVSSSSLSSSSSSSSSSFLSPSPSPSRSPPSPSSIQSFDGAGS